MRHARNNRRATIKQLRSAIDWTVRLGHNTRASLDHAVLESRGVAELPSRRGRLSEPHSEAGADKAPRNVSAIYSSLGAEL
jgi:hypothetical protein